MISKLPRYVHVDGHAGLVRDTFSMGVINTNTHGLAAAKRHKLEAMKKLSEAQQVKADVLTLRKEIADIRDLLMMVLNKLEERS